MKKGLAIPLSMSQIEAAQKLYNRLPQWQRKNRILQRLKEQHQDISDVDATLLKVVAINQFYFTNLWAVDRMTEHIVHVMPQDGNISDTDFVEELASLAGRKNISFASKFAHFFIDPKRFPIYDSVARDMIKFHMGWKRWVKGKAHEYQAFCNNLEMLRRQAQPPLSCDHEDLDRYLWLVGLYKEEITKPEPEDESTLDKPEINREVWELFQSFLVNNVPSSPLSEMLPSEFADLKRREARPRKDKPR